MAKYEGWSSYGTWGVALVLSNDEQVHLEFLDRARELAAEAPDREEDYWSEEEYVKFNLADQIKDFVERTTEDFETVGEFPQLMISQVVMAGLSEVDWHEIAGHYMEE